MEKINKELNEMFDPTERCFKGLSIVFLIYGSASLLALLIVSQITQAHLNYDLDHGTNLSDPTADTITSRKDILVKVLSITGAAFYIIAFVNIILMRKYKGIKGRQAQSS